MTTLDPILVWDWIIPTNARGFKEHLCPNKTGTMRTGVRIELLKKHLGYPEYSYNSYSMLHYLCEKLCFPFARPHRTRRRA